MSETFSGGEIFKAIPKIMTELAPVAKDKVNKGYGQNYNFRGIDDLYNALCRLMGKHGVFTTSRILDSQTTEIVSKSNTKGFHKVVRYEFKFYASDGSFVTKEAEGEAMDYSDKVSNKCIAMAHKYALMQVFCVPTEDLADGDHEAPEAQSTTPEMPPRPASKPKPKPKPTNNIETIRQALKASKWSNDDAREYRNDIYKCKITEMTDEMVQQFATIIKTTNPNEAYAKAKLELEKKNKSESPDLINFTEFA